ncbi:MULTISPECIES: division/cell wall cluster transcriptional repressor MraZ [Halocynthiibacter]|uniref:Transcriptional regulator MraZ n=1 Tax=Halocynthiibacter halioticoli TaxID=2986804 RepID=A0AAE3IZW3_9RHOB|nr:MULTISPECIES: division/cell wall cluster transcriptional repressor MraZ [Halocynthiibacter]MCV6824764.1 division/cell wall cluster transcriptional repressor MraZ [Halocynthiibacter halioticoli]MCW4057765.1 division/cell wall cluster transcriptional repressor MraZ [Halocynthiibacter sp. SDUM655004]MDE0589195.1 division/cell wall cluster transcriptional repressor MraZ [Halocynthiibacter sp. C4]
MARTFRGESVHKVDAKGRVSIPALFRRVLEAGDPDWQAGQAPRVVIVYGDYRRQQLECFTQEAIEEVDAQIAKLPRGSKRRQALQRLYSAQAFPTSVDETGRLVLPAKLRKKIGLQGEAYFVGNGDTFEIWSPETYEIMVDEGLEGDEDFDPDADPSIYLDGIGED